MIKSLTMRRRPITLIRLRATLAVMAAVIIHAPSASPAEAQASAPAPAAFDPASGPWASLLEYVQSQKTTGFLIVRDGKPILERNWPLDSAATQFRASMVYGSTAEGAVLQDAASQQKSVVSFLIAVAIDKRLLDPEAPVSRYVGQGWTKASPEEEARIRVLDVLTMSSGLTTELRIAAAPGTRFLYNTPVYAVTKTLLEAVAHQPLDVITKAWLTGPAGMPDTRWRRRPASMADQSNPTGLVTSPRDMAKFGQIILDHGRAADGRRLVSDAAVNSMFVPSSSNPAYGRLWWLNSSAYSLRPPDRRTEGPLIPAAPFDLIAALGALDQKLYIVPSLKLVVVRLGQAAPDSDFDEQLWRRLSPLVSAR